MVAVPQQITWLKFCLLNGCLVRGSYTKFCLLTRSRFRVLLLVCFVGPMVSFLLHASLLFLGLVRAGRGSERLDLVCCSAKGCKPALAVAGWVVQKFPGFNFNSSGIIM